MHPSIDRINRTLAEEGGFVAGTALENRVAYRLTRYGMTSRYVAQQYAVGKYRLDFAWPDLKIALEVDGWWHRSPEGAERDARRDAWLRSQGWLVFRIDDLSDVEGQLVRVVQVVHSLDEGRGEWNGKLLQRKR